MQVQPRPHADRLLTRLAQVGIATFLLISAFDIHRWRREPWQLFELEFAGLAGHIFNQPARPTWLYFLAFPFVAVNFGCLVQLLRGRRRGILPLFVISAVMIAAMPLFGWQTIVARMIWEQLLTALGYAVGGAIAVILALDLAPEKATGLDTPDAAAKPPAQPEDS